MKADSIGGGNFAHALIQWHKRHGRKDLPWQATRDPYRVWLSEIMLQQTQVATVLGYYGRFLARFADVQALAQASLEAVLESWSGLGYYSRARLAHRCAQEIVRDHGGRFPRSAAELVRLPGIGASTAAAIAAFCFAERAAILDANVQRVLARRYAIAGNLDRSAARSQLWDKARQLLPPARAMGHYTQAIMDLGATVCKRSQPRCAACPVAHDCAARLQGSVERIPMRQRATPRPVRRTYMLLVIHRGTVLLHVRPPAGIWGGLMSPPEFVSAAALLQAALTLGDLRPQALDDRRHGFTHFTLQFTPYLGLLHGPRVPMPAPYRWLPLGDIEDAALPAPVRRLLHDVHQRIRQ